MLTSTRFALSGVFHDRNGYVVYQRAVDGSSQRRTVAELVADVIEYVCGRTESAFFSASSNPLRIIFYNLVRIFYKSRVTFVIILGSPVDKDGKGRPSRWGVAFDAADFLKRHGRLLDKTPFYFAPEAHGYLIWEGVLQEDIGPAYAVSYNYIDPRINLAPEFFQAGREVGSVLDWSSRMNRPTRGRGVFRKSDDFIDTLIDRREEIYGREDDGSSEEDSSSDGGIDEIASSVDEGTSGADTVCPPS